MQLFLSFILFWGISISAYAKQRMIPILWNMKRLEEIGTNPAYKEIVIKNKRIADYYVNAVPVTVVDKKQCISGNKHNYESLSSYCWPDPNNPKGEYIVRDGILNPEVNDYDRVKIDTCAVRLRTLAQVYYWTKEEKYYRYFRKQLTCWFLDSSTKMLPNLDYGQIIKGKAGNKGQPHGIIDIFPLVEILESVRLMDQVHGIDKLTMLRLRKWTMRMLLWLQTSELGIKEGKQPNNHGMAYDVLCLALASFSKDKVACESIIAQYGEKRLNAQIDEQGVLTGETRRTRAYMYSIINFSRIVDFCIMSRNIGTSVYESNSIKILKCAKYLSSFIGHKEKFPYKEMGNWSYFDNELKLELDRLYRFSLTTKNPLSQSQYKVNYMSSSAKYAK